MSCPVHQLAIFCPPTHCFLNIVVILCCHLVENMFVFSLRLLTSFLKACLNPFMFIHLEFVVLDTASFTVFKNYISNPFHKITPISFIFKLMLT